MLSAVIPSERGQPAVPLARQLAHQRFVRPGPLVLGTALLKSPTPTEDRDRHVCYLRVAPCHPAARSFLFRLAPRVATGVGPSLHGSSRVRRMASEDSGQPIPGRFDQPFLLIVRRGPEAARLFGLSPAPR